MTGRSLRSVLLVIVYLSLPMGYASAGSDLPQGVCVDGDVRFSAAPSGVITEQTSGLQWYVEKDSDTAWTSAADWASSLMIADGGWRLPSVAELRALYDACGKENGVPRLFRLSGSWIWAADEPGDGRARDQQQPAMHRAVAFDSGAVIAMQPMATFNLRAVAVRGEQRPQAKAQTQALAPGGERGMIGPLTYVSTAEPAIRIRLDKVFHPVGEQSPEKQFLFNRKGQSAYVLIRHSADMAPDAPLRPGSTVESWMAELTREWIVDAGAVAMAGDNWLFVDRLATDGGGKRCVFIRDLRLYTANQQFLNIVFFERLDRVDGSEWTSCRPLSDRQRSILDKVTKGFTEKAEIEKYAD